MARYQVILEQSGMPEATTHVMAKGIRRLNGAINEAKMQFLDAVNNMFLHTDVEGGEYLDAKFDKTEDGFDATVSQYWPDGRLIRYRRVYIQRKGEG